ncbi:MAG TPA: dTDP-4-dehydrorhamnose reductase [Saprospiraceae bacterium]|nr:dTDP-4-dehydrorhamnose reductase [Saprospiraceae bacterium]HND87401.1 dTDP-4-dehydrorhamnose reductase [Saprospiraceae bacterium]HNG89102.1 dTDP-4-dehydrorhamnose reductase [Saprospiraceae bacterium]
MILITGANGQLGQCFRHLAGQQPGRHFHFAASQDLDISRRRQVQAFFREKDGAQPITWVINCAAYTAVDKAESEARRARQVNADGPRHLAEACAERGIPLLHLSTDYVYHSRQNTPFREDDPVSPKGVYARTKLAGDRAVLQAHPTGGMVVRTSWVYAPFGHNFVRTMLRLGAERPSLGVVFDQIGSPTYAPDLAAALLHIIQQVETGTAERAALPGIWHYSHEGVTSWYDFAQAIFDLSGLPCQVRPIETRDFPTPAQRPPFSVLNKAKIKAAFGLHIPHWRDGLTRCLAQM